MTTKKILLFIVFLLLILISCQQNRKNFQHAIAYNYILQAHELYENGDTLAAVKFYDKAIELDSLQPDWFYNRGVILEQIGDSIRGFADLLKSIEIDSLYEAGYFAIGATLYEQGKYAESIYYGEKLVFLNPDGWTSYGLGLSYYQIGEYEKALRHLMRYDTVNKDQMWTNYFLGMSYKGFGNMSLASEYLNRASEQGLQEAKEELDKLKTSSK